MMFREFLELIQIVSIKDTTLVSTIVSNMLSIEQSLIQPNTVTCSDLKECPITIESALLLLRAVRTISYYPLINNEKVLDYLNTQYPDDIVKVSREKTIYLRLHTDSTATIYMPMGKADSQITSISIVSYPYVKHIIKNSQANKACHTVYHGKEYTSVRKLEDNKLSIRIAEKV